jgi:hypothetical protein
MKIIYTIVILLLIISLPVWAESVYTNSSLKKYDAYKSRSKVENNAAETAASETSKKQNNIEIIEQKMNWAETSDDGSGKNYNWQVKLANTFAINKEVKIEFNLIDKEGKILSVANGIGSIDTNETKTFSGTGTIKSDVAAQAVRTSVTLTAK